MTPERVLAALVAHSQIVDFRRPDPLVMTERQAPAKSGSAFVAYLTADERAAAARWDGLRTALGRERRSLKKSGLHEAAAEAMFGMPSECVNAIYTAIRAEATARDAVQGKLERIAVRSQRCDNFWPDAIKRLSAVDGRSPNPDYVPDLIELAIQELEYPTSFDTQLKRAEWFGASERNWYLVCRKPYDLLAGNVWLWYYAGIGHILRRLARWRRLADVG